jgi:hypothetical protein
LLFIDSKQFIQFEFDVLTDPKSFRIDVFQRGKMEENVFTKVLRPYEPELSICNDSDDLADSHRSILTRDPSDYSGKCRTRPTLL